MNAFELTRRLIDIESITGNEREVALYLADYLKSLNYLVSLPEVAPDRFNVRAFAGAPVVVLTTHIDTVPPFIQSREDEEFIHGRGACDAKGIVAAQIAAAERLRGRGEERVGLLFVVGEERNSAGALHANMRAPGSRYFVDGEPTENKLAVGAKGSLRVEIVTRGKAAHSAYPEMGESAILKLLDLLQEIRNRAFTPDPVLGETTVNIAILEGGTKPNVIPDRARAEIMYRLVEPAGNVKAWLESILAGRGEITYPFEVPIIRMTPVEGFEQTVVAFSSDLPFLSNWGSGFLLGPGSILDAHTEHERISKAELLRGIDLYERLAVHLLSEADRRD